MLVNKSALIVLLALTACASHCARLTSILKHASGYQGTTSDTKAHITGYWQQRAHELCPKGYSVESHKQTIVYGTIRSPVNGMMVNLGTVQPIDKGIIQCLDAKFVPLIK